MRGFTLIELLIVVAIIGLLASTILVGLGPFRQAGRDARRIVDLREVQNGLEIYFKKCSYYPGGAQAGVCQPSFNGMTYPKMVDAIKDADLEIIQLPRDPLFPVADYYYAVYNLGSQAGRRYILGATLEDINNPQLRQSVHNENLKNFPGGYSGDLPVEGCDSPVYCVAL